MNTIKVNQELTWKKLFRANRETTLVPFLLALADTPSPLVCEKVLRIIPGKRVVAYATWNDQEVVAKLFYNRRDAKRHVHRDIRGIEILQSANVPTPKLLYKGSALKGRVQVLILERIHQSKSLDAIWQEKEMYAEINALMHSFTIELATQHVLGILQRDLHLKNFLITDNRIYTIDGAAIIRFDNPLDKKLSLENLGLFFAQLGVGTEQLQRELFQTYVKARSWIVKPADVELLQITIANAKQTRWRNYQEKIFRTCTAFKKTYKTFKTIIYDRDYHSAEFLNVLYYPDKIFTDKNTEFLKKGRSATVAKFTLDGRHFVIKRYNIKNSIHWLQRCLRPTRAQKSWRMAQLLRLFGIATAKPIAFIETQFFGLRGKSYFIMEYLPGPNSGEYFSAYQASDARFETVAKKILALFNNLGELQLTHGDLKWTNIIIERNQPMLIDLDGMCEHKAASFRRAYQQELQRFMRNWKDNPKLYGLFENILKGIS